MSQIMPPLTMDEFLTLIDNPNFKTCVILGDESDETWSLAQAALNFLPGLQIFLVKSESQPEVRQHFDIPNDHVALIFGRSKIMSLTLSATDAGDFLTVTQAISNA